MEDSRKDLQELVLLKSKLEIALDNNDEEEIKKTYDEFRNLYKKLTGKEFEEGLPDEKLSQIESVINGTVSQRFVSSKDIEKEIEM